MNRASWQAPYRFSPAEHERELRAVIEAIEEAGALDEPARLERILARYPKGGKGFFSRSELVRGYRYLARRYGWRDERRFERRLRMKPVRTLSGVVPVTVLTQPYPCPGRCIFCPSDVRMPKSYLSREPGAQRAAYHRFDPYGQTRARLRALRRMGHPVDKVELIVLGGTWSAYPEGYRLWFLERCFDALNEVGGDDEWAEAEEGPSGPPELDLGAIDPAPQGDYDEAVASILRARRGGRLVGEEETASWEELEASQKRNETAAARAVGLSVETRPDRVDEEEVLALRRSGVTKVQLGVQSLHDDVLAANRRGHDVAATRRAFRLLREAGFKIQAHWMPNLYGATPETDREDFARLFDDEDFRPDELKIYPVGLVEGTELMTHYRAGRWRPYDERTLSGLLGDCLARVPPYCRVSRVVRDIPGDEIVAGNRVTNLRQRVEAELARTGRSVRDIRARELRSHRLDPDRLRLVERWYAAADGTEGFLELVTPEGRLAAFLRLRLPRAPSFVEELRRSAVVRELHVYGAAASLGEREGDTAQHAGLGGRLLDRAAAIAAASGFDGLAVISSVGTREYYRRRGFADGRLYQHRSLGPSPP